MLLPKSHHFMASSVPEEGDSLGPEAAELAEQCWLWGQRASGPQRGAGSSQGRWCPELLGEPRGAGGVQEEPRGWDGGFAWEATSSK